MSDLKLVPPDEPTELERLLIEAAANEKPSPEHKLRVREALGLAIPLSVPPPAPAPGAATTTTAAGSGSSSAGALSIAKVLAGGIVSAGAVGAVIFSLATPSTPPPAPAPQIATVRPAPTVEAQPAPAPATLEPAPAPAIEAPPKAETKAKPAAREQKASTEDDLRQQIVLIEAARAHVAQQNPWAALQALDTYASKFKGGSFDQEAAVLRMKAVEQTGDRARAASLARSFLERYPTSPHVERVRRIAEPTEPR